MKAETNSVVVPALNRALDILDLISRTSEPMNLKAISEALNIPNASCYRIVKNLESRGYLIESGNMHGYFSIGFELLKTADRAKYKLDLRTIANPFMRQLSISTNLAVQLGVLESNGVVYIEQMLPMKPVDIIADLYTPTPINISAAGKVLCAHLPLYKRTEYIQHAIFKSATENSIMDKQAFTDHLKTVSEQGYALDQEEYSVGIGCLAVPIFDYTDQCTASIGVTGDYGDFGNESITRMLGLLKRAAGEISLTLGYSA